MHTIFHRYGCLLLALILLNCSVDAPDARSRWKSENLSYNEQESIVELVLEKVLDLGDVIPEYDDTDCDEPGSVKKTLSVDLFIVPDSWAIQKCRGGSYANADQFICNLRQDELPNRLSPPPEI